MNSVQLDAGQTNDNSEKQQEVMMSSERVEVGGLKVDLGLYERTHTLPRLKFITMALLRLLRVLRNFPEFFLGKPAELPGNKFYSAAFVR